MATSEAEWWEGWWEADWSWEGLLLKPVGANTGTVHGGRHGERNLQEYWRRDPVTGKRRDDEAMQAAGELVQGDGRFWHLAHVPLQWRDGSPAKAALDASQRAELARLIEARITVAAETTTDLWCKAEEPDGRAQLAGAVLLITPGHSVGASVALHLVCDRARLPGWVDIGGAFGSGFRCEGACFSELTQFDRATFLGHASFDGATFSKRAEFRGATFSGGARFERATFLADAAFDRATFSDGARFESAGFSGSAGFEGAKFSGHANFDGATFSGEARFSDAPFSEYASFNRASFSGLAFFGRASFAKEAHFQMATFLGYAGFHNTTFSDEARFNSATFSEDASFYRAAFSGDASFDLGEFKAGAYFDRARFIEQAAKPADQPAVSFAGRRFKDITSFDNTEFHHRADFKAAIFERNARFTNLTLPKTPALWQGMFDQAQFKDVVNFRGTGFQAFAAFDGANFAAGLQLDEVDDSTAKATFQAELAQAIALEASQPRPARMPSARIAAWAAGQHPLPAALSARIATWLSPKKAQDVRRDLALKHLERGCRVLKQAMEKFSDKAREQLFYAFELTARRHQCDTPAWERFFSRAYAFTGDYGRSISRPLLLFAATIPAFAVLYWLSLGALDGWSGYRESLTFAAGRVLPFGPWQVVGSDFQKTLLGLGNTWFSVGLRLIATLQSLLGVTFAFLAGLALRRRFQIS